MHNRPQMYGVFVAATILALCVSLSVIKAAKAKSENQAAGYTAWRTEPTWVENRGDDLWGGLKV